MADGRELQNGINDSVFNSCAEQNVASLLDTYSAGLVDGNCAPGAESPKRAVPSLLMECPPMADDSSDSICRVDLPSDMIVASPMKISDILSLLLESPEKSATSTQTTTQEELPVINDVGVYINAIPTVASSLDSVPLLRRSHSWHDDAYGVQRISRQSPNCSDCIFGSQSLRRTKSVEYNWPRQHYESPTSLLANASWFPSISVANAGVDVINALLGESADVEMQEAVPPEVNILGYSLPLVPVDGNPTPYVCATDVFQTFFSTRHWDEFKSILEKNGIRCVAAMVSSIENAFGVPEVVDVIDVKEVESLLLSNQARKDGFVRCVRLSMNNGTAKMDESIPSSTSSVVSESKIVMMPERHVGELSSGIRTRHGDQSDILYVEVDGHTLPSIVLRGAQYVRLVDVQKKFFSPATPADEKERSSMAMHPHVLKNACASLKINVQKCKPNEKARMVVYANSCHSSSLHIIAAEELPRLIEYMRRSKRRGRKSNIDLAERAVSRLIDPPSSTFFSGNLHITIADPDASNWSSSASTPGGPGQLSPLSRPGSENSAHSGSSSSLALFTVPPSPVSGKRTSKTAVAKRRASLNGPFDGEMKKRKTTRLGSFIEDSSITESRDGKLLTTGNTPMSIWQNGHLKTYPNSGEDSIPSVRTILDNCYDGVVCEEDGRSAAVSASQDPDRSTPNPNDVNLVVNSTRDLDLGRDEDNLLDTITPKDSVSPCKIVVDNSTPLPVVVYNRRGSRGPAGKYYDHLFASRNAACIWCYGCTEFYNLPDFLAHIHDSSQSVTNPQLFVWVSNVKGAKLELWRSLLWKARKFNLSHLLRYNLPDDFDYHGNGTAKEQEKKPSSNTTEGKSGQDNPRLPVCQRSLNQTAIGGGPVPPPPMALRRRPVKGDAYLDVMERYSAAGYKPLSPNIVGLYSTERERAIDAAYNN